LVLPSFYREFTKRTLIELKIVYIFIFLHLQLLLYVFHSFVAKRYVYKKRAGYFVPAANNRLPEKNSLLSSFTFTTLSSLSFSN